MDFVLWDCKSKGLLCNFSAFGWFPYFGYTSVSHVAGINFAQLSGVCERESFQFVSTI